MNENKVLVNVKVLKRICGLAPTRFCPHYFDEENSACINFSRRGMKCCEACKISTDILVELGETRR